MPGSPIKRAKRAAEAELQAAARSVGAALGPLPTAPRTSPAEWTPAICEEAVLIGATGRVAAQIAAHLSVAESTLQSWAREHPELQEALARAETQAKAWWLERARTALETGDTRFPAGAWAQVMRAVFPAFDDRSDLSVRVDVIQHLVVIQRRAPAEAIEGEAREISGRHVLLGDET